MAEMNEILSDLRALLADAPRGRIKVSPEFAAWLETVGDLPGGGDTPSVVVSETEVPAAAPTSTEPSAAAPPPAPPPVSAPPVSAPKGAPVSAAPSRGTTPPNIVPLFPDAKPAAALPPLVLPAVTGDREADLAAVAAVVSACTRCGLCQGRTQTVFSDGSPTARVMMVGEAPGADEDRQGVPFVGKAGQLLTRMIERVLGMQRHEVYICNAIKCRPPGNRDPHADEKAACLPYLEQQIALVQPSVIVALGRHAGNALLASNLSTARLRGRWHEYRGIPLRVTYHPAYILRCEREGKERERTEKLKVKEDLDAVLAKLADPKAGGA